MNRVSAPTAARFLRRSQLIFALASLIPTILMTLTGVVLVILRRSESVALIAGILVVGFCASSITGYVLGAIFLARGATLARVQHEFLSAVSHEIRTPLTSMQLYIETLRDERVTGAEDRARCLAILHQEVRRLDGLVGRFLALSKLETGRNLYARETVQIGHVFDQAVAAFDAIRVGTEVEFTVSGDRTLEITGDPEALAQAVTNLLSNAWKYSPPDNRKISLTVRAVGRREIEIAVGDNGPGVDPSEHSAIFDVFSRGQAARNGRVEGVGLGLAIVRETVRAHRGRSLVRTSSLGGAEFVLVLPRHIGSGR